MGYRILKWILDEYVDARNGLIFKNLIAFDGHVFQVLDLPDQPLDQEIKLLKTEQDFEKNDPATIQNLISMSWGSRADKAIGIDYRIQPA
jgi:hypothetical protein